MTRKLTDDEFYQLRELCDYATEMSNQLGEEGIDMIFSLNLGRYSTRISCSLYFAFRDENGIKLNDLTRNINFYFEDFNGKSVLSPLDECYAELDAARETLKDHLKDGKIAKYKKEIATLEKRIAELEK